MKKISEQNPLILALAIIGLGAILYFLCQGYQQYAAKEQARSFFSATPSGRVGELNKPSNQPPPQ